MQLTTSLSGASMKLLRKVRVDFDQPNWRRLRDRDSDTWDQAKLKAERGPKVLIATSVGAHIPSTTVESLLAVALTLRGADVHILLCDKILPACSRASMSSRRSSDPEEFGRHGPQKGLCWDCFPSAFRMYEPLGLHVHKYSDYVALEEAESALRVSEKTPMKEIATFELEGMAVGEHALAGALRFFGRGDLDGEAAGEAVLRRYLRASLLTVYAARRLLGSFEFAASCFNHGIYVPQGLIGEVARERGVRIVNWNPGYRTKRFIFSHGDTYHHTLLSEPTSQWEDLPWTTALELETLDYLKSRWQGSRDWISFNKDPQEDLKHITDELGIDFSRPTIGLLTNVMWDAQLHYKANAFANMLDWVLQTINYFAGRPDLHLVIRVHPAELTGFVRSRQPIVEEIQQHFGKLPGNVFIIPPESEISTYAVMDQCNAVVIYGTKTGVELTSVGIPVIVAGEAWIRNKGITTDASSPAEYFSLLDQLPLVSRMDGETVTRARKYAYHFFFRRMIPIQCIEPSKVLSPYRIQLDDIEDLLPGNDPGLDVICDGIINGSDFVYPAELYGQTPEVALSS